MQIEGLQPPAEDDPVGFLASGHFDEAEDDHREVRVCVYACVSYV